jgi:hypothetical protein
MTDPKAILFRVEWDDGTIWTAEGDTAAAIMKWYQGCESMNAIHGASYKGPQVTISVATQKEK